MKNDITKRLAEKVRKALQKAYPWARIVVRCRFYKTESNMISVDVCNQGITTTQLRAVTEPLRTKENPIYCQAI